MQISSSCFSFDLFSISISLDILTLILELGEWDATRYHPYRQPTQYTKYLAEFITLCCLKTNTISFIQAIFDIKSEKMSVLILIFFSKFKALNNSPDDWLLTYCPMAKGFSGQGESQVPSAVQYGNTRSRWTQDLKEKQILSKQKWEMFSVITTIEKNYHHS